MEDYVKFFNREINGGSVKAEALVFYAKIGKLRSYTERDKEICKNRPSLKELAAPNHEVKASSIQY